MEQEIRYWHWFAHRWMCIAKNEFERIQRVAKSHNRKEYLLAETNGISYLITTKVKP